MLHSGVHHATNLKILNWLCGEGESEESLGFLSLPCHSRTFVILQLNNVPLKTVAQKDLVEKFRLFTTSIFH